MENIAKVEYSTDVFYSIHLQKLSELQLTVIQVALDHLEEDLRSDLVESDYNLDDSENLNKRLNATQEVKKMFRHVCWKDRCSVCRSKIKKEKSDE